MSDIQLEDLRTLWQEVREEAENPSRTTPAGVRVTALRRYGRLSVVVDHDDWPPSLRHEEVGEIVHLDGHHAGGFKAGMYGYLALTPEVLRAIAELVEETRP